MTTQRDTSTKHKSRHTQRAPARLRTGRWGERGGQFQIQPESSLRARVAAAFREIGNGVDPKTAYEQTKKFFRSGGSDWARRLY
jgi:hypothetical protein